MQERIEKLKTMINAKTRAVDLVLEAKEEAIKKAKTKGSAIEYISEIKSHTIFVKATISKEKTTTRWHVNFQAVTQDEVVNIIKDKFAEEKA